MKQKVLIITYYWPPSGGSGVQRWMYFAKYLHEFGIEPNVITVDEKQASYKFQDASFKEKVKDVVVYHTDTREPLRLYSKLTSGDARKNIPTGFAGETKQGLFQRISRYVRGNFFIPDARIGWNRYALKKARKVIAEQKIDLVITTGPPHSTHLVGLQLKKHAGVKWIADFRDPWTEVYYNKLMYRTQRSDRKDKALELSVLNNADLILTVGPSMKKLLMGKAPEAKIEYIYNGYDSDAFRHLEKELNPGVFTICHLGILGESQPITAFVDALMIMHREGDALCEKMKLQCIGKVSPAIMKEVKMKLPWLEVEYVDYVPHEEALKYIMNASLLFNSLAEMPGSELLISGKLMEYIATGNPVLCLGNPLGDAASLLSGFEDTCVFARNDPKGIAAFIRKVGGASENGKRFKKREHLEFSRYQTARKLSELIKAMD
jgi:glycosyltransferase involved in cell wall biosynthesis